MLTIVWTDQLTNDPLLDEQATVDLQRARGVAFAHLKQTTGLVSIMTTLEARVLDLEKQQNTAGQVAFDRAEKEAPAFAGATGPNRGSDPRPACDP